MLDLVIHPRVAAACRKASEYQNGCCLQHSPLVPVQPPHSTAGRTALWVSSTAGRHFRTGTGSCMWGWPMGQNQPVDWSCSTNLMHRDGWIWCPWCRRMGISLQEARQFLSLCYKDTLFQYAGKSLQKLSHDFYWKCDNEVVGFDFCFNFSPGKSSDYSQLSSCIVQVCTSIGKFFKSMGQERVKVSLNIDKNSKLPLKMFTKLYLKQKNHKSAIFKERQSSLWAKEV